MNDKYWWADCNYQQTTHLQNAGFLTMPVQFLLIGSLLSIMETQSLQGLERVLITNLILGLLNKTTLKW